MKSGLTIYCIFLLVYILGNGCEKNVKTVDTPPFEPKLAIASFISPADSGSLILVSSNRRLYGELSTDYSPGNLNGTLSNGSTEMSLDTTSNGLYISHEKMPIEYGTTYSLRINSDKGLSAEASCRVPERRDFSLKADTFSILYQEYEDFKWYELRVKVTFTDYPGEENFYRILGKYWKYYTYNITGDSIISERSDDWIWFEKELMTDAITDINGNIQSTAGLDFSFTYSDSSFIKIYLLNTEKSYYLYHKSLRDYSDDENPFQEATPVYSNVKGGLGIFTSYTVDSLVFRLK